MDNMEKVVKEAIENAEAIYDTSNEIYDILHDRFYPDTLPVYVSLISVMAKLLSQLSENQNSIDNIPTLVRFMIDHQERETHS